MWQQMVLLIAANEYSLLFKSPFPAQISNNMDYYTYVELSIVVSGMVLRNKRNWFLKEFRFKELWVGFSRIPEHLRVSISSWARVVCFVLSSVIKACKVSENSCTDRKNITHFRKIHELLDLHCFEPFICLVACMKCKSLSSAFL